MSENQSPKPDQLQLTPRGKLVLALGSLVFLGLGVSLVKHVPEMPWQQPAVEEEANDRLPPYVVGPNETIWGLSAKFAPKDDDKGLGDHARDIMLLNDLKRADALQPGQVLELPADFAPKYEAYLEVQASEGLNLDN